MIVNDNVVTGSYNDHLSMLEGIEKLDGNPHLASNARLGPTRRE